MERSVILLLAIMLSVAACGEPTDDSAAQTGNPDHFLSDQEKALNKARQVEQLIQNAEAEKRKRIDEQSGY